MSNPFSNQDKNVIQIPVKTKLLWLVLGLVLTICSSFFVYSNLSSNISIRSNEIVIAVISTITSGVVITTLLYNVFNYRLNYNINVAKLEQDRKNQALVLISECNKKEIIEATVYVVNFLEKNDVIKESDVKNDIQFRVSATIALNLLEKIAIAVESNVADEVMLKTFYKGIFKTFSLKLKKYIEYRRELTNIPTTFIKFEKLAEKWNNDNN